MEGDSAGGSAKQGRNRKSQAILPLRGKILNVEKARFDKIISSQEIRNLFMALQTGVGKDDYDIKKLRYHKVVIMTDADVDGAHIRTLLLTFFYRQMPELIENGYLYIAQPPLYGIKQGKKDIYLKNEQDFQEFILKRFVEDREMETSAGSFKGNVLLNHIKSLNAYRNHIEKFTRRGYPETMWDQILPHLAGDGAGFIDKSWTEKLAELLEELRLKVDGPNYDEEHNSYWVSTPSMHNGSKSLVIDRDFVKMDDMNRMVRLFRQAEAIGGPPYKVIKNEVAKIFESRDAFLDEVYTAGQRGLRVQRYKGLGEMNASQLWDTTMDPEKRTLLQVNIEDAVEVDEIFTILMGDKVEPRRDFIQDNALRVRELDI